MNPTKKQILELRKGLKRVNIDLYSDSTGLQKKIKDNEYCLYLRVDAEEVIYIDKKNIIKGEMTEKVFDTIDSGKFHRSL